MSLVLEQPTTRFDAAAAQFAPQPAEFRGLAREDVRLLVARPEGITHARFRDLPEHLEPGDAVVVNNSATVAGQLDGIRMRGGMAVVVHLAAPLDDGTWVIELRTAPDAARAILDSEVGEAVRVPAGRAGFDEVRLRLVEPYPFTSSPTGQGNRLWRAQVTGPITEVAQRLGRPISYGYLDRSYDLEAYQTVFAAEPGSAEMPSAARPFTHDIVTRLVSRGVAVVPVTLHTGVSSQEAGEGPQAERFRVSDAAARQLNAVRAGGGRIVAVGTTATRAVESAVEGGVVVARSGWTERIVTPGQPPAIVDGLITGWHDPQASHLLLVEAVAGGELTPQAYDAAVAERYLWHEFGDSALLLPARS